MINNKRIIKALIPSIAILLTCATLIGNNEAYAANVPYSIIYDDNVTSNMPTDVDTTSMSEQVTMANNTPTRPGFKYLGWCNVVPTNSDGTDLCTGGTSYQPSATLPIDQTSTGNNFHFYAMWKEPCVGQVKMQELTSSSIATLLPNEHSTATVCDTRDEEIYTIAKLKDGKYWMVENLNLAGGTSLSADDTDLSSTYISSFSTSNNLTKEGDTIKLPASSTSGFDVTNNSYVYNSGNKADCESSGQNIPCYSYYSWDAATLGSGRTNSAENANAEQSICPKGWKLPSTHNGSGTTAEAADFRALMIGYGGSSSIKTYNNSTSPTGVTMFGNIGPSTVPNFTFTGSYYYGSFRSADYGDFWSSTSNYASNAYSFELYNNYVASAVDYSRNLGHSVRCLFSGQ